MVVVPRRKEIRCDYSVLSSNTCTVRHQEREVNLWYRSEVCWTWLAKASTEKLPYHPRPALKHHRRGTPGATCRADGVDKFQSNGDWENAGLQPV